MGFIDFFARASKSLNQMHYTHSTCFENFCDIFSLSTPKLTPKYCTRFKEDLIYLFYGVPSYRVADYKKVVTNDELLPVCFVLDLSGFTQIDKIYPFDSGAFIEKRYNTYISDTREIGDFCLGTDPDIPKSVVEIFFGSNKNYYIGNYIHGLDIGIREFYVKNYYELISATGKSKSGLDKRKMSIEIQTKKKIVLDKNTVRAVALPLNAMDDPEIKKAINKTWNTVPLTYHTHHLGAPGNYNDVIWEKVFIFLEEEGVL